MYLVVKIDKNHYCIILKRFTSREIAEQYKEYIVERFRYSEDTIIAVFEMVSSERCLIDRKEAEL